MNKELIKKYKNEFNHWLNGGEILTYDNHHCIWHILHPDSKWDFTKDLQEDEEYNSYGYVINDDFVEFRKALAEGKTIQFNNAGIWKDIKFIVIGKDETPSNYRIKPELPFKAGDWITVSGPAGKFVEQISGINEDTYTLSKTNICYKSQAKLWTPEPGEWCWFWDEHYTTAILAKFENISNGLFVEHHGNIFEYCEPFIGELPSYLKDK